MTLTLPGAVFPAALRLLTGLIALSLCCLLPLPAVAAPDPDLFPNYPSIRANVDFWEKIYSTYSVNTAIIHDREDLSRIYTVIALQDRNQPGARQHNEKLIENTRKHYADLLRRLARNGPKTTEEKRVAGLFGSRASTAAFNRAIENIRAQTGLKEQFLEGVIRSGAYLATFKKVFRSHGLPEDLAYLPHVESSFNPRAFSRFGASGMWQFTTDTGKEYMRVDYIIDERRDPFIAAEAAARLLKRNHQLLGSWPLTLTSYNYGASGMRRAVAAHGDYESIFKHYRTGWFKFAARNFYPSFVAAVTAAKRLEKSPPQPLDKPVPTVSLRLPGYTDSIGLCRHLGISRATLAEYNPALREPVLDGHKYIPKDYVVKLPAHLQNKPALANLPASLFRSGQRQSEFYQVRPGDTAGAIARAHRVSLKSLIDVNGLDRQATVRVGQNLRIPPQPGRPSVAAPTPTDKKDIITLVTGKKSNPPGQTTASTPLARDITVIGNLKVFDQQTRGQLLTGRVEIQPDETITLLAHWLKATPQSIHLANKIDEQRDVQPGQTIVLDFLTVSVAAFEAARFDFHQEKQEDFYKSYRVVELKPYTVSSGDTLWDLCHNTFNIPLWLLKKYNETLQLNQLTPLTTLQIPVVRELADTGIRRTP